MRHASSWLAVVVCALSLGTSAPYAHAGDPQQGHAYGKDKEKHQHKDKGKHANKNKRHGAADERGDGQWNEARLSALDRNHDGVLTRAEWRGDDRVFGAHDSNHDGVLSGSELRPWVPAAAVRRDARTATRQPVTPQPVTRADTRRSQPATERDEVLFARADANHDGRVTRAEWRGSEATFARLDTNRDGALSPYEYGVGR